MGFFEENISVLARRQPELADKLRSHYLSGDIERSTAKTGLPAVKFRGVSLHSSYDPIKEAEKLAAAFDFRPGDTVILKGFGLGYIADIFIGKDCNLIACEAELDILKTAFELRDLRKVIEITRFFTPVEEIGFPAFLRSNSAAEYAPVFNHAPSIKLNPEFYASIDIKDSHYDFQTTRPTPENPPVPSVGKKIKILLVGPLYGGSLPVAEYCRRGLEQIGHTVEYFDSTPYYPVYSSIENTTPNPGHQAKLRAYYTLFVAQAVLAKAMEVKPDLVFGVAQSPFTKETLEDFRKLAIPTAFWFVEDYKVLTYWKNFAPLYDYFFTIQKGDFFRQLDLLGAKNYHYLPLAADPEIHKPLNLTPQEKEEFGSILSFIGAGYPNRRLFFLYFLKDNFKLWGTEWDMSSPLAQKLQRNGARISSEECVKIFNAASININLHSWMESGGVNPEGDFVNPRTFEIAACGAFQLVDNRSELPRLFEIGKEIITFNNIDDFQQKKQYYLAHPQEMSAIASSARLRVLREHTYKHRMEEMLKITMGIEPENSADMVIVAPAARLSDPNAAGNLLRAAENDPELKALFSAFPPEEILDVDKIAAYIRSKNANITNAEGIFLLMKEFADWGRQKKVIK